MLIGLVGRKRVGKDTVAFYLENRYKYKKISLADPIREMIEVFFRSLGIEKKDFGNLFYGDAKDIPNENLFGRTPRYLLQSLGTEWGRTLVDPNVWIECALRVYDRSPQKMVVSDVRFQNEADAIVARGGKLIKIHNPRAKIDNSHPSEIMVDKISTHFEILNVSTFNNLYTDVDKILRQIG